MPSSNEELSVRITGDVSGLEAATAAGADALSGLQANADDLNAQGASLDVEVDTTAASRGLGEVASEADALDQKPVEISPALELDRINRDIGNLQRVLAGIEARKANPDVGLDLTQLLRDEARVNAELEKLNGKKVEAEAKLNVDETGFNQINNDLEGIGSQLGTVNPRLGGMLGMVKGMGPWAAAAGAAFGGWKMGELAGDVETMTIQLDSVFGNGEQVLDMLRQFANGAPFGLDSTATAARTLGLAGIKLKDIPGLLEDIGTAASLAPGDLDQNMQGVSTVVGQMLNKGHIMAEEVQQLAEQGVPAWQALAESQGTSVANVQKLVTEGKLGRGAIIAFVHEFSKMFPQAMSDQADSFNGKMSTLKDTWTQAGSTLGSEFLPLLGQLETGLIKAGDGVNYLLQHGGKVPVPEPDKDAGFWERLGTGLAHAGADVFNFSQDWLDYGKKTHTATEETLTAAQAHGDLLGTLTPVGESLDVLTGKVTATGQAYENLLENFTATNDAMSNARSTVYDYQGALDDLRSSLKDGDTFAPTAEQGRANWQALVSAASAASDRIVSTLRTKGADAAESVYTNERNTLHRLLTDAGVKSRQAWRLVNQVLKAPHTMHVELDHADEVKLTNTLARLNRKKATIETHLQMIAPEGAVNQAMLNAQNQLKPITGKINATTENLQRAKDDLAGAANPDGRGRTASIKPQVDPGSLAASQRILNELAAPATKTIRVHLEENPTGQTLTPQDFAGLGPSTSRVTIGTASTGVSRPVPVRNVDPVQLAPRQTPVKVYLDGAEIADHLDLSARRIAAGSARRLP